MVLGVLIATLARAGCEPVAPQLDGVEQAVLRVRLDDATAALRTAETAFGCGTAATAADLARFWILEGALLSLGGDPAAARDSFAAAARTEPSVWLETLGPRLREQFDAAGRGEPGRGRLTVEPAGWTVQVDGRPHSAAELPGGLHLVQVLDPAGEVLFGKVVIVVPDQAQKLSTGLAPPPPPPPPAPAPVPVVAPAPPPSPEPAPVAIRPEPSPAPSPAASTGVSLVLALGAAAWLGEPLEGRSAAGTPLEEPALKWVVPVDVGLELRAGPLWGRGTAGVAPLLGGRLLYGADGAWAGLPFAIVGQAAAGVTVGPADVGVQGGVALPGRLTADLVGSVALGDLPLRGEVRIGLHGVTARAPEPSAGLAVVLLLPGAR